MKRKTLFWIIGIAVILIILLVAFGGGGDEGTKVAVEKAAPHTIIETVTGSGKIYPETEVKISPEVSGEIIELRVAEGDSVMRGQLIARINPATYSSMVNQAAASVQQSQAGVSNTRGLLAQAQAQYDLATSTYGRNQKLFKDKVISSLEMEQATSSYQSAKAAYESAKANISGGQYGVAGAQASLSQAQANLQKTIITAPTNGIISQLNVKLGERVVGTAQMAGTELLTIANMSRLEVRVDVSETDIAKVSIGDTALIETDAYRGRKFKGVVSRVDVSSKSGSALTASSDQVSNYTVRILILPFSYADLSAKLARGQFVFKPGMSAAVEIQTRREADVLSVPVNAVTTRDWPDSLKKQKEAEAAASDKGDVVRQVVFIYNGTAKTVALRDVSTGIQDNTNIQILKGLKNGEEVVTAPYGAITRLLKDKGKVRVVKKEQLFEESSKEE